VTRLATTLALLALACLPACLQPAAPPRRSEPWIAPAGNEIVACGRRFFVGAPVVLWNQAPGYDATRERARFGPDRTGPDAPSGLRYQPGRKARGDDGEVLVEPESEDLERLREVVDQFVLHYDVAGTSRRCFEVLQDVRGLSVHFLLDVDGTIYQTLDLRDQAWHATKANPRSIGIEIANLGAYPPRKARALDAAYRADVAGPYFVPPDPVRTPGFVARPARTTGADGRLRGRVQGEELEQFDFTREQYASLAKLAAALCVVFPRIEPDAPRDDADEVRAEVLSDEDFEVFRGILGHFHVQRNKADPGPAFDWEGFLAAVREELARRDPAP
jgi:N-acetyl-anhydromuramyl-L-alanine amidase AmpD